VREAARLSRAFGIAASAAWYALSMAACCAGTSLISTVRFAAATAASTDVPRAAPTASCTAVCTIAMARTAGGVPSFASVRMSPARTFQSVITSARALRPAQASARLAKVIAVFMWVACGWWG
jgi:hypothetical protein